MKVKRHVSFLTSALKKGSVVSFTFRLLLSVWMWWRKLTTTYTLEVNEIFPLHISHTRKYFKIFGIILRRVVYAT